MSTMNVLDSTGATVAVEKPLVPGQALMAASRPVVIASDQSAVPVSGTITANVGTGTQPVSGTFWQATQPVSIASSVAVTGTFFQATQPVSNAGTFAVQAAQSGTWNVTNVSGTISLPTGASTATNQTTLNTAVGSTTDAAVANGAGGSLLGMIRSIKDAATDTTTPSPTNMTQLGGVSALTGNGVTGTGSLRVTIASDNTAFSVNATATPATTAHALIPAPSTYRMLSAAATTNGANIKASAGTVKGLQGFNAKASAVYLKLYNKASSPTVGTDTPVKTIYLPATAAFAIDFGTGVSFATGISIAITGAAADADTTALVAGDVVALNVDYH